MGTNGHEGGFLKPSDARDDGKDDPDVDVSTTMFNFILVDVVFVLLHVEALLSDGFVSLSTCAGVWGSNILYPCSPSDELLLAA